MPSFVDGSGREGVYKILKNDGYNVAVIQRPTVSLSDDVAVTKRAVRAQSGSGILVGHSYGGAVITEAGNDPKVTGLVYIAGWLPGRARQDFDATRLAFKKAIIMKFDRKTNLNQS